MGSEMCIRDRPKYMLPNLYEKLEALPYNANGKIDRVALKERYLHAEG